ncbi:CubicO group peptidase (beta-lactamase class C family) [Catalinimonas alkaloidigena]|uniref:serine hydrolase domain-containing protein n=1 Tax=Catalinimonas alkaloidigena TaxID=1075417 RepID=UPI002405762C|nr:serine hydrolase [Catalinimonas alkaloidigena]MDF9800086.1 CubicO group peptidase (beta-lactamase class C family) [Catalinimonas alkaloidigena]
MINTIPNQAVLMLLSLFLWAGDLQAQHVYYPEKNKWEERVPEEAGLNASKLNEAITFAREHEYEGARDLRIAILKGFEREPYHKLAGPVKERGGPAGLIIKDGYIVAKWGDVERVDMTFSVTKSYLSTIAGLAVDDGLIGNVDDPVQAYVWDGTFESEHNSKIQWKHLLHQSSDWSGSLFGMYDWADRPPNGGGIDDWKSRTLLEPGTNFEYNDVRVNVLAYSLLQVWRKPLPMVLKEKIMDPIGASSTWRWYGYENSFVNVDGIKMQSVSGGGHSGGGLFINTLDHARFGLLFLRNGKWRDQQLVSERWIKGLQQSSPGNESYGYMWWLNKGNQQWEGVSSSVYYAAGFGGNFIVVDQENDLIVVTRWLNPPQIGEMMRLVTRAL